MGNQEKQKQPSGGLDKTPLKPTSSPTYTLKIIFHSASNIPVSDFGKRSSDPFILAQLNTGLRPRHSTDPPLRYRSKTAYSTTEPRWESSWTVAGIPESGFKLKVRLYDEDPEDHDDRLGHVYIGSGRIIEGFQIDHEEYRVHKKGADLKAYGLRSCTAMISRKVDMHARVTISIKVLGRTKEEVGKAYTLDCFWWKHFSPLIGRIAGTKAHDDQAGVEKANFQSNEFQLRGPVPTELYHRYVEFKPLIGWMFRRKGISGWALHKALHHQHERIYNFDKKSKYGRFDDGPGPAMTRQFLDMVHYDQGGRVFTYVITLDGMFRFTETGKEFGIDMLSKHTMHSDVHMYIAWSGEFLVRRLEHPNKSAEDPDQETHPTESLPGGPPNDAPPTDPKFYELIIDNDSGTYRPDASLLPVLQKFLEKNLVGLQVVTMACDDEKLDKIKEEQVKAKKEEGEQRVFGQHSATSSISSSDASDLEERAKGGGEYKGKVDKGVEALQGPKEAIMGKLPGKGKREREKREEKEDDQVADAEKRETGEKTG